MRQGLGIITGQQKGFSWSSVAASAVGGAVGNVVGGKLNTALANPTTGNLSFANNLFKGAVTNIASNVATQLTQIALDGKGKLSWTSVAVAGIYGIGSGLEANRRLEAQIAEQRAAQGNTTAYKSAFTGERINVAGGVGRTDAPVGRQLENEQKDLLSTNPSEGGLSIKAGAADSVKKQAESLNAGNSKGNLAGLDQAIGNIANNAVNEYFDIKDAYALGEKINSFDNTTNLNRALYERAMLNADIKPAPKLNPINLQVNNFLASQSSVASSLNNYATYGSLAIENIGKVEPLNKLITMPYKQAMVAKASLVEGVAQFVDRNGKTATLLANNARTYGVAAAGLSVAGNAFSLYDEFLYNQSVVLSSPNRQALVNTSSVVNLSGDVAATAGGARVGAGFGIFVSAYPAFTPFSPYIIPLSTAAGGAAGHYIYDNPIKEGVRQFFGLPKGIENK